MVQMLSAAGSLLWDCPCYKATDNFTESEEQRLINKGLARYVKEDMSGNVWTTDELGLIQIELIGLSAELIA